MSAIIGIYYRDSRPLESQPLEKMLDVLAHRGEDGVGIWKEGSIGLGNRLLWTTPESLTEQQPLVSRSGNLILTADARIDNREELISSLELTDIPANKITDSQIILNAYEKWGESCPERFLGDFAFAIWDKRSQSLFCARDHFGVRSLYYYFSKQIFTFATEIKALFQLSEVPRQLNEVKVAEHLAPLCNDSVHSYYQDILRLPPAHWMKIGSEGLKIQSYWSLNPHQRLKLGSDGEYVEAFRDTFAKAVGCRLRSAFPVGSMLSGGLDSSSVTVMARQLMQENGNAVLPTFSAIFEKVKQCDESFYQNAVIGQGNIQPYRLHADSVSPLTDLERLLWHIEEPLPGPNTYIPWCLHKTAQKQGIRAILDGWDGDTVISHGRRYLLELAVKKRWLNLYLEMKAYGEKQNLPWREAYYNWLKKYGIKPIVANSALLQQLKQTYRSVRGKKLSSIESFSNRVLWNPTIDPDFAERIDLAQMYRAANPKAASTEQQHHYQLITRSLIPQTLERTSKAAAALSIELRHPFWDKRLVEFCLSLPPEQKMTQGLTRMIMRRGMKGLLPPEVQERVSKSNLAASVNQGLLNFERDRMEKIIFQNSKNIEKYIDIVRLRQSYKRFASGDVSQGEDLDVWRGVSFALWLQQALDT